MKRETRNSGFEGITFGGRSGNEKMRTNFGGSLTTSGVGVKRIGGVLRNKKSKITVGLGGGGGGFYF